MLEFSYENSNNSLLDIKSKKYLKLYVHSYDVDNFSYYEDDCLKALKVDGRKVFYYHNNECLITFYYTSSVVVVDVYMWCLSSDMVKVLTDKLNLLCMYAYSGIYQYEYFNSILYKLISENNNITYSVSHSFCDFACLYTYQGSGVYLMDNTTITFTEDDVREYYNLDDDVGLTTDMYDYLNSFCYILATDL